MFADLLQASQTIMLITMVHTQKGEDGIKLFYSFPCYLASHRTYHGGLPGQKPWLHLYSCYSIMEAVGHNDAAFQGLWTRM